MTRCCSDCGREFEAKGDWMKLCWPCWHERNDKETRVQAYNRGYDDGYRAGYDQARGAANGGQVLKLDCDLLRPLIQLCHPDRHPPERAAVANAVTARLLNLEREAQR